MSKHHRDRSWAPAPQPLPDDAHVIDNHTHVASVVPFSRAMSHEAAEKGQPEVPVYSVDELLSQAQAVGVEGVIDCGCELPNLMTAIDMAREHPALAKELGLPMQIHDRDSHKEVIETLLADGAPERTVFHSYSGDAEMGEIARENGWYLSLSGTSSYKGNDGIRESVKLVGLDHIMIETDAPYLSPMPYRGRTNAPYMIPYTLQALANYLDKPLAEIARATRETTRKVYGI